MRKTSLLALTALLAGCAPEVLNPNATTGEGLLAEPNGLAISITGIEAHMRTVTNGDTPWDAIIGREGYNLFPTDARFSSHPFLTPTCNNCFHSGFEWTGPWAAVRNLANFEDNLAAGLRTSGRATTEAERNGALGFARTVEAYELSRIIMGKDDLGSPTRVSPDPAVYLKFESRDSVYRFIVGRLADADAKLAAAGASFAFPLSGGWRMGVDLSTPAGFRKFNRALAARVLVVHGSLGCGANCYQAALTALAGSFLGDGSSLTDGAYHLHSTTAGDAPNPLSNANADAYVHPRFLDDVPATDLRRSKIRSAPCRSHPQSAVSCVAPNLFPTQSTPFPIITREELILIRAEARWFTGNRAGAISDIDDIRSRAGGLGPSTLTTSSADADFVTELLAQRKMSLFLTGHRWEDVRRFGRLNTLPLDFPNHLVASRIPVPQQECVARSRTGDPALAGPGCP